MEYEGQICRAPMERASFMLPVMVGCSYNQCRFCMLFKHLRFRILPLEQIEAELQRVKSLGGNPQTVFLGDGNAFCLDSERLLQITSLVHRYFPGCREINMDATVTSIAEKSDGELRALRDQGVRRLYLGIESGLDDVLAFMHKDHTIEQAYQQIERLHRYGFIYDAHMMTGIAGHGRGLENAEQLAQFFNRTQPGRIINFSLFLHRSAPLYQDIQRGAFSPADELENLVEERRLLQLLQLEYTEYDGFHDFLEFRVRGTLPQDQQQMIAALDREIAGQQERRSVFAYIA